MEDKVENIEYIRKEDAKSVTWEQPSYTDPLNILTEVRDRIESIKPADVAPVVHGKWILGGYDDMFWICDKCEHRQSDYSLKPKAKYCPNCGAKMDAQREE